jgi:very-short-patch-repair endonuclease
MPLPIHFEFSRRLRKESTPEESRIWELLRNRKFHQLKFTRQYPILISNKIEQKIFFIADFYCASLKLILELDGGIHKNQIAYDKDRDHILIEMGYKVIRIKNEIINEDPYRALKIIEELIKGRE